MLATKVEEVIKVTLDDGRIIECRPLKIKYLREFMARIADLSEILDDNVESLEVLLDCSAIAMRQYVRDGIPKEELEEILDLPMMYRIVEGASGIKLDDGEEGKAQERGRAGTN